MAGAARARRTAPAPRAPGRNPAPNVRFLGLSGLTVLRWQPHRANSRTAVPPTQTLPAPPSSPPPDTQRAKDSTVPARSARVQRAWAGPAGARPIGGCAPPGRRSGPITASRAEGGARRWLGSRRRGAGCSGPLLCEERPRR